MSDEPNIDGLRVRCVVDCGIRGVVRMSEGMAAGLPNRGIRQEASEGRSECH